MKQIASVSDIADTLFREKKYRRWWLYYAWLPTGWGTGGAGGVGGAGDASALATAASGAGGAGGGGGGGVLSFEKIVSTYLGKISEV